MSSFTRASARVLLCTTAFASVAHAADEAQTTSPNTGFIETVIVKGKRLTSYDQPGSTSVLSAAELERRDIYRASEALELVPGLHFQPGNRGGGRNEASVYLRGFDLSRVPVLLDGIPIYVPYDGYIDLNRLQTFDLAGIEVARGYSSVLYGPNAMGGAINLVSRRPDEGYAARVSLRADFADGIGSSGQRATALASYGAENFYVQAGLGWLDRDFTALPDDFSGSVYQPPGKRLRSFSDDLTVSLKAAWTPGGDEYALTGIIQDGRKGAPPYAGPVASSGVFFDWPYYDKRSVYFTSRTDLGQGYDLRARLYYDAFQNQLKRYDDVTYTTQTRPFAFTSSYDDDSWGGSAELAVPWIAAGDTRIAAFLKQDTHRESNPGGPVSTMRDLTGSIAVSTRIAANDWLHVSGGFSYDWRTVERADNPSVIGTSFDAPDQDAFNWQIGFEARLTDTIDAFAGVSQKSRFATMFERFSYRLGNGQPNPGLEPETLLMFEAGLRGDVTDWLSGSVSVFTGEANDYIQSVVIGVRPTPPFGDITQNQNIGDVRVYGLETELSADYAWFSGRLAYTWLDREITNRPGRFLIGTPRHKVDLSTEAALGGGFFAQANLQHQSGVFTTDSGTGNKIAGRTLVGLKAGWRGDTIGIEAAVSNLTDELYEYDNGFPGEGRTFSITLRASY